ncbi:ATP-binding cassette domain-containing protein [Lachnospiraceae bacterium OttesenSCG-928-D06]|nr:ATP-binding cassette domain-containing protein [Lachnospiraceae bacterium OttesenSCG-928-D06]
MSILNVEHLTHGFGDRAIFQDVSFRLLKGEHIGLIGANGEGKSTFMNIITGKLMPDEGKIEWAKNVRVGYLDQHTMLHPGSTIRQVLASAFDFLYDMEREMNEICDKMGEASPEELEEYMEQLGTIQDLLTVHDFYLIDSKVEEVGRALGLSDIGLDRDVSELSGGQRTKVLLGKLLLEKPDILLLDEPTNYLDVEHIEWLKRYLNDYENAFILISHDIPFLNSVINLIYHMDNQELNRYVGDYNKFEEVYSMKKSQLSAAYNKQQKEIAELKDFVARNKARVATRNMAMSRQKKLEKMDVIELDYEKPKPEFHFKDARTPGRYIFQATDLVIGYNEPLSKPMELSMERGEKIALIGANGIGKTTLLKSLLGQILPISGHTEQGDYLHIGYFEQELTSKLDNTCLEEIWQEFPGFTQYEVRSALAKCGLTTKHIESKVRVLSGGEQAKVRLCKLINRESNILVLDEPTNHLDVDAKAALKQALLAYKGSVLMVCHEPEFYEGLVTAVWDLSKWTTKIL